MTPAVGGPGPQARLHIHSAGHVLRSAALKVHRGHTVRAQLRAQVRVGLPTGQVRAHATGSEGELRAAPPNSEQVGQPLGLLLVHWVSSEGGP